MQACCVCPQVSCRKGRAKRWDHAQLVHHQWMKVALEKMDLHVGRVATDDNIADLPSRAEFEAMKAVEAQEVPPVLGTCEGDDVWDILSERWSML